MDEEDSRQLSSSWIVKLNFCTHLIAFNFNTRVDSECKLVGFPVGCVWQEIDIVGVMNWMEDGMLRMKINWVKICV